MNKKLTMALYGAAGAVAPDILILYSKRWTAPSLTFNPFLYICASAMYMALGGVVAAIFPYGRDQSAWRAFAVGVTLPLVLAGITSAANGANIAPRGTTISGTFWDLISLF